MGALAIVCIGCSSSGNTVKGETENNFDQSSYDFSIANLYKSQKTNLVDKLKESDIQFVEYGDTMTLIIPVDSTFSAQSSEMQDMDFTGLNNVVKLLKQYPTSQINIAAFSDDSGSASSQMDLTQAQAEKILTFLWANGIPAKKLTAQGYGENNSVGSNKQMHSSAYNRRVEIQWSKTPKSCCPDPNLNT